MLWKHITPQQLQTYLELHGYTQKDFARLIHRSPQEVHNWLSGKIKIPHYVGGYLMGNLSPRVSKEDLKDYITTKGYTYEAFGKLFGYTRQAVYSWVSGKAKVPPVVSDYIRDNKEASSESSKD
jgi:transcriptional regulator with XRE-family HTH domain